MAEIGAAPLHHDGLVRTPVPDEAARRAATLAAYERLAPVWSSATDDGLFNGVLERRALRRLVPLPVAGRTVLDAGCGAGAQCEWLLDRGAEVIGIDLSPAMVAEAVTRCRGRGRFHVADLGGPLGVESRSVDGITSSLVLHYLQDWAVPLRSFARILRPGGWVVLSLDHPMALPLVSQRGTYFDTELVGDTWKKAGVEVTQHFWRRPLSAVVDAFAAAGFVVERVAEPQVDEEAIARFGDEAAQLAGRPTFIVYRLRLAGGSSPGG